MSAPATSSAQQTVGALFDALDGLDLDALTALFSSEPQGVDELSGGWRRGRDELRKYLAGLTQSGIADVRSSRSDEHVAEWGDTALVTLVLDQTYTLGGERQSLHAPTSIVLRREDGEWRVALVHSVPLPDAD
jgi:uncharacterized protein (TIGR02246 family)